MDKKFYITTTLPYVNAPLHLGHAVEMIRADAIARHKKLQGYEVFFNTGTDEHGQKIFEAAVASGKTPQEYTDYYANLFKETLQKFGIANDENFLQAHYVRTTDERHVKAAQEFWKKCFDNGYIYKKNYSSKYCVGCEEEKTDSEIIDGKCPIHPNRELEIIEEENYFFKLSEFNEKLLKYYEKNPGFITPEFRMNEMREFIKRGLQDFSISRLKSKMSWGVPVPGDEEHVMYVWFDALTNYISTLDWPENTENFEKFWVQGETVQYCGKDNTRFQGVMWQAMLMAAFEKEAGAEDFDYCTKKIAVNGFILGEGGVKMSKSLGNVIDPLEIVDEYGTEALRYFVLREFSTFEDTAVSKESLKESYNANLANGIGNLTSRIMTMAINYEVELPEEEKNVSTYDNSFVVESLEKFNHQNAADYIWKKINDLDKEIQVKEPFKKIKVNPGEAKVDLKEMLKNLCEIGILLSPFMPETSKKIIEAIKENKKPENLFVRKD